MQNKGLTLWNSRNESSLCYENKKNTNGKLLWEHTWKKQKSPLSVWQKVSVPSPGSEIIQHRDIRERGQAMSQEQYKENWTTEPLFKDTTGKEVTRVLYKLWKNGLTNWLLGEFGLGAAAVGSHGADGAANGRAKPQPTKNIQEDTKGRPLQRPSPQPPTEPNGTHFRSPWVPPCCCWRWGGRFPSRRSACPQSEAPRPPRCTPPSAAPTTLSAAHTPGCPPGSFPAWGVWWWVSCDLGTQYSLGQEYLSQSICDYKTRRYKEKKMKKKKWKIQKGRRKWRRR